MKPTKCSAFLMFPGTASVHRDMRHQNKWDAIDSMYELPPLCSSSIQSEDINVLPMYKSQLTQCIQYVYYRPMDHQCWIYLNFNAGLSIEGGRQQKYTDHPDEHCRLLWRHTSNFSLSFRECMYSKTWPSNRAFYFFYWKCILCSFLFLKTFFHIRKGQEGKRVEQGDRNVTWMWHQLVPLQPSPLPCPALPCPTPPRRAPPHHVYVQPKRCKAQDFNTHRIHSI